jgi:hypothetical protein
MSFEAHTKRLRCMFCKYDHDFKFPSHIIQLLGGIIINLTNSM